MTEPRFRVNADLAAAKAFDDEFIVINVATGRYYSLEGTGAVVWELLGTGVSVRDIAAAVSARFDVAPDVVRDDVAPLIDRLLDEGLVIADTAAAPAPDAFPAAGAERGPYAPPVLETYTDMEELLAADPPMPATAAPFSAPVPDGDATAT